MEVEGVVHSCQAFRRTAAILQVCHTLCRVENAKGVGRVEEAAAGLPLRIAEAEEGDSSCCSDCSEGVGVPGDNAVVVDGP